MNKEEFLQLLAFKVSTGEISSQDVLGRLHISPQVPSVQAVVPSAKEEKRFSVTKMLYVLGAAIVVIGIVIFAYQVWGDIGSTGRIAITLGLGFLLTILGSVLLKTKPGESIGPVFHAMGGVLIPGGSMVTLYELFGSNFFSSSWPVTNTFGIIFIFYLMLTFIHKHVVLTLFSIFNGTAFLYLLIEAIIDGSFYMHGELYAYLTMVVGASYILLAHSFRGGWNGKLIGVLYFLGSTAFLGAAFSRVFDSFGWQMLYFLIVIGGLFLSVSIKSRGVLIVSTLFLLAHVSYITSEYFANSLGWPISLIVLGFIFIGLGYVSINISKKYIQSP